MTIKISDKIRRFFYGRYGTDQLCIALVVISMLFSVLGGIFENQLLQLLSTIAIFYALYRMLSKKIHVRRNENAAFLKLWNPITKKIKLWSNMLRDIKTHRYFSCPGCKNTLRVPKGKGEITITCPVCKKRFDKRT